MECEGCVLPLKAAYDGEMDGVVATMRRVGMSAKKARAGRHLWCTLCHVIINRSNKASHLASKDHVAAVTQCATVHSAIALTGADL